MDLEKHEHQSTWKANNDKAKQLRGLNIFLHGA